jgi:hypothetical protein
MIFCMFGVCVGHTGVSVSDYLRSNFDKSCCIKSNHRDLFNHPPVSVHLPNWVINIRHAQIVVVVAG